ncbi:MAG: hypothetical protein ACKV2T_38590 [Kofleriaceae bacterium]
MRRGFTLLALIVVLIEVANADMRPRLESFTTSAPAWAKDCSADLVAPPCHKSERSGCRAGALGDYAFSVAIACRSSEELIFERRAKQPGPKSGTVTSFDGATRVVVWKTGKYATDVYACTSTAEVDAAARCRALVDAVKQSTIVRRGADAFTRPKS